jgi:hypothetical protein
MGVRWPKQARHTWQMDRLRMRGEEQVKSLQWHSACKVFRSERDGVMASVLMPLCALLFSLSFFLS